MPFFIPIYNIVIKFGVNQIVLPLNVLLLSKI